MASEDVIARLRVEGQAAFGSAMRDASGATRGVGTEAEAAGKKTGVSAGGLLKAAAAAGALYKGYGFLKDSIGTTVNLAKSTAAFSRASGLDQKQSQAWVVTAQQRGIQTKQLQMGMATLGRNLGAMGGSTKASDAALAQFGVTSKQLLALPMNLRMGMLADQFQAMPDGVGKAALAQKLFGRSGQALLPILNAGGKALNEQLNTAGRLVPVNEKGAASALKLVKQQRELGMATTGIKTAIGNALLPVITRLASAFLPVVTSITALMTKSTAFRVVVYALTAAFAALAVAVIAATLPITGTMAIVAGVVVGIAALAAAFATAYQKVGWFRAGVDAVIGALSAVVGAIGGAVGAIVGFVGRVPGAVAGMASAFAGAVGSVVGAAGRIVSGVASTIGQLPGRLRGAASSAVGALVSGFNAAVGKMANIGRQIVNAIANAIKGGAGAVRSAVESIIPDVGGMVSSAVGKVGGAISNIFGTGGIVAAQTGLTAGGGTTALVGERGPEIASFPSGTRITPLPPPSLAPSQLMGGSQPMVAQVFLESRMIAEAMASFAADRQAAR